MKESLLIFEKTRKGRIGVLPAIADVPAVKPKDAIPEALLRKDISGFPEVSGGGLRKALHDPCRKKTSELTASFTRSAAAP